jgi:hypothetical protein
MKTSTIFYMILITILLLPATSPAQWVQTIAPNRGYVQSPAVSGTNLVAGTYGGATWQRPLSEMVSADQETLIVNVGEDKVFTDFNYHTAGFENDPRNLVEK